MLNEIINSIVLKLKAFDTESVELLKKYHIEAGQKASGKTLAAFGSKEEIEGTTVRGLVFGAEHTGALEYGRKPTTQSGGGVLYNHIYEWVKDKGFNYRDDRQRKSIAYAITKTIHEKGTYQFRSGTTYNGFKNPISKAFEKARIMKLQNDISEGMKPVISSEVLKQFKQTT
jgi:hypothetical protein